MDKYNCSVTYSFHILCAKKTKNEVNKPTAGNRCFLQWSLQCQVPYEATETKHMKETQGMV